jgi:RNA polymerase sigma factor (sigma-70 family)
VCEAACAPISTHHVEVVVFYAARWCQKRTREAEPNLARFDEEALADAAGRVVRNLAGDGERVDRLFAGDREEWRSLKRLLTASAASRVPQAAGEHADEALSKIAVVIFTGTPPSRAVERLAEGPEGPRNEYIFTSPFENWARTVVINQIIDEVRRARRDRRLWEKAQPQTGQSVDERAIALAKDSLKALVRAIEALPPRQRSVMVASLCRRDVDDSVHDHLHEIAPDLFVHGDELPSSDGEIARSLGTTTHRLAANRSAARRKLAHRDPTWGLLLDGLLPHRSTKPHGASPQEVEQVQNRGAAG